MFLNIVLVQPPFTPCEAIASLNSEGICVWSQAFSIKEGATHTLALPILEQYIPNIHLSVRLH